MNIGQKLLERTNKVIYRSEDNQYLIKVFNHTMVPKSDVLQEATIQSRVEELNEILIPSVEEVFKIGDDWCIASKYIEGKTLDQLIEEEPSRLKEYMDKFVLLQIKMHSITASKLQTVHNLLGERINTLKGEVSASSRYELHLRLDSFNRDSKLVQLDYNLSNIVVTSDNKWYILDWAHARKGQPEADVALTYLNFMLEDKKDMAELYLKLYIKHSDIAKQVVNDYLPLLAAYKLSRGHLSEEQTKYLLSLTNIADYQ